MSELDLEKPISTNQFMRALYERTGICEGTDVVTPADGELLPHPGWIEVTGNAGNIKFDPVKGATGQTRAFDAKECSKFQVKRVYQTGTNATGIVVYYQI